MAKGIRGTGTITSLDPRVTGRRNHPNRSKRWLTEDEILAGAKFYARASAHRAVHGILPAWDDEADETNWQHTGIHSMARQAETGGHARPGEELALYTGMGTKQCRLITRKKCIATDPIALDFLADVVVLHNDSLQRALDLDGFARFDGFRDWSELAAFWHETHGVPEFRGWHICWLPLP